jgi:hypothetical protein
VPAGLSAKAKQVATLAATSRIPYRGICCCQLTRFRIGRCCGHSLGLIFIATVVFKTGSRLRPVGIVRNFRVRIAGPDSATSLPEHCFDGLLHVAVTVGSSWPTCSCSSVS